MRRLFSEEIKRRRLERTRKRMQTLEARYGSRNPYSTQIRMYVSPWFKDDDGCMTRFVRQQAAE